MVWLFPKEVTENYLLDFYEFFWDLSNVSWPKVQANSSHFETEFDIIVILNSISTQSPDYRLWILWFIRDFESFEIICWRLTKYSQEEKKNHCLSLLLTNTTWKQDLNPNVLAPHGHIPFPGLTDEVVWEAFWLGEITLLNGDVKSNVVSWKFPASTWEWSSWKSHGAGSTSLLRNTSNSPTEPSVITALTLLLQRGKNHSCRLAAVIWVFISYTHFTTLKPCGLKWSPHKRGGC